MSRRYSTLFAAVSAVVLATPAAAQRHAQDPCSGDGDDDRWESYCEVRAIGWRGAGRTIAVDASPNGGVSVAGWGRDSVHIVVAIHAKARTAADARDLASHVTVTADGGQVHADGPASRRGAWWWVSYRVNAPQHSDLTLETINGPLEVDGVSGTMELTTRNGPLSLYQVGGDVRARAQNGPLTIELAGSSWDGQGLDAETQNGPVTVSVPEGYNAELETGTVNGPMNLGMPVTIQGRLSGRQSRIHTTLGRGGPAIRAVSTNGPATIRRIH